LRALCLHGHFYQPPREHPWLGVVEPEATAAPARDWNTRITAECYAPNAAARVLDAHGRLSDLVNTYAWTGFDFGPTLLNWLAPQAPAVLEAIRQADVTSRGRTGHGNAWAQAYGHAILPLSTPRDVRTQVRWGKRDFEHRFGRSPEGMWLPEMAVDRTTLTALAEAGISLTMLAPHQARRIRPVGAGESAWRPVEAHSLDTKQLYRCFPAPGLAVDIAFRDAGLSEEIAFGPLLRDGAALAERLRAAAGGEGTIVTVAVDGETFGHHHAFGEMALAFALSALAADREITLAGPAAFRTRHPPTLEVEIAQGTSWSCPHGVERWRGDCACGVGPPVPHAWRAPLRQAIDWLRDELADVYATRGGEVLRDPWGARDRYIDCLLDGRVAEFLAAEGAGRLASSPTLHARRALELGRHALFMQTSCGWFFDELTGVEPVLVLRHAARAIELARHLGRECEEGFVARLAPARSNLASHENGADFYRRVVLRARATPSRIAATAAMMQVLGHPAEVPGYTVHLNGRPAAGRLAADAEITEEATGAVVTVPVVAERPPRGAVVCRVGDAGFVLSDLFGGQRERVLAALENEVAGAADARRAALVGVRPLVDQLLVADCPLPARLAELLGWEGAEKIAAALEQRAPLTPIIAEVAELREQGAIFPAEWLACRLVGALEGRLASLPEGAGDALLVLDVAAAAGVQLDLGPAQVQAFRALREISPGGVTLGALRERLRLAPSATTRP